jgi:L-ascorbate metabolism protein UlaG (beta-lactamase superfamily)
MRITKFGHACLLVEEGKARILVDPGVYSKGFEDLTELGAILVTHQHADHMTPDGLKALLDKNPEAKLFCDEDSGLQLRGAGLTAAQVVHDGDGFEVSGVSVKVIGVQHATIHPDIPGITNVGYFIAGRLFVPGDNFTKPEREIEILGLPLGAPWSKVSEIIDYVMAVKPRVAIPIHDAVLAMPDMHIGLVNRFAKPAGIEVRWIENGSYTEV